MLYDQGKTYSTLNTARSALSTFILTDSGQPIGQHPVVKRLMRGVFVGRPSLPKYSHFWNITTVLRHLSKSQNVYHKSLADLSRHLVTLLAILSAKRCQTLNEIDIRNVAITDGHLRITTRSVVKHTRPGHHESDIVIAPYPADKQLCDMSVIREYLIKTTSLRGTHTRLLLSSVKPFTPVSRNTVSSWIKTELGKAGIDITVFGAHSTRGAAVSATRASLDVIMRAAGWSSDCVFRKFYKKPVTQDSHFADTILRNMSVK